MNNMISPLHQTAIEHPNAVAIILPNSAAELTAGFNKTASASTASNDTQTAISYAQLSQLVLALAQQLSGQGVAKNHRLACISRNNLEMICLYWACIDLGALFFPISPRFPAAQISQLCLRFNINYYWSEADLTPQLASVLATQAQPQPITTEVTFKLNLNTSKPLRPFAIDASQPVNVILTSGSSGTPKGVVHSLSNHIASATGSAENINLDKGDSWLLSLPLFHIGGLAIVNRCAIAAATIVLSTEQPLVKQLAQTPLSHLSLVSAQLSQILDTDATVLKHVKALLLGGGAIDLLLVKQLAQLHISAFCSYGMSEMSSQITTAAINSANHLGTALPQRQLKLVDGVIWVKGPCLFLGYLQASPDHSLSASQQRAEPILEPPVDENGWFCTNDQGQFDDQGQLHLLGRVDNMFICGGENIHPEEIEAALRAHPDIAQAIVFGQYDAKFSLLPAAIIQFKAPQAQLTTEVIGSIEALLLKFIARFKRPRHYYPWPDNIESASLKIPRKQIIAAVKSQYNLDSL
ncbi:o-succinylbenzoate--CoA ligase [Shewanella sp. 10N.286.48.A6]|uniref:o-succinylbenzoate--CoA ligase n=1 Tax=Shewanella sp. 10N.286.48.A6 TaxID=1880833 RepID=UPI000C83869F|nr:o-succinylbenzoate--CoA ligase [Shewanella sp. 10N.286.48.A6]PMH98611.1 o-succinylbenzoate--CoA ligase [Shewanella sp. 10N.286.48.A6]